MDVSSIRSLLTLVIQLQTVILFAQGPCPMASRQCSGRPELRLAVCTVVCTSALLLPGARSTDDALSEGGRKAKMKGDSNHRPCCFNGGLCVLGTFCHCPKNFYGRHCEYEMKEAPCGHVPHGSWLKAGCNLCRCYDGRMTCLPRAFDGCDDKPPQEVNPWDYKDEMVVLATDASTTSKYDAEDADYYDYYENGGSSSGGARTMHCGTSVVAWCGAVVLMSLTMGVRLLWRLVAS